MIPTVLYKFKPLESEVDYEYIKDIIENFRLYAPNRSQVNDPFEGLSVDIRLGVAGFGYCMDYGVLHPSVIDLFDRYRYVSFSGEARSPILWAYYASNYSGVCFEFSTLHTFHNVCKVEYNDHPSKVFDEEELYVEAFEILKKALLVKSNCWKYEKEWRLFADEYSPHVYFTNEDIKSVIIGPNFDREKYSPLLQLAEEKGLLLRKAQPICPLRQIEFLPINYPFPFDDQPYTEVKFTDI